MDLMWIPLITLAVAVMFNGIGDILTSIEIRDIRKQVNSLQIQVSRLLHRQAVFEHDAHLDEFFDAQFPSDVENPPEFPRQDL